MAMAPVIRTPEREAHSMLAGPTVRFNCDWMPRKPFRASAVSDGRQGRTSD